MKKNLKLTVIFMMLLTVAYSENILAKRGPDSGADLCNGLDGRIETILATAEDAFGLFKQNADDEDPNYNYKTCAMYEEIHSKLLSSYKLLAEYRAEECNSEKVGKEGGKSFTPDYLKGSSGISDAVLKCSAPSLNLDSSSDGSTDGSMGKGRNR